MLFNLGKNSLIALFLFSYSLYASDKEEEGIAPAYVQDYAAGEESLKMKEYERAIDFFQKSLKENPDYVDAMSGLSDTYMAMAKDYIEQAWRECSKALILNPNHPEVLEIQGECFLMTGQIKRAYENYRTLKKVNEIEAENLKSCLDLSLTQAQEVLKRYTPQKPLRQ